MRVVTSHTMQELDRRAITEFGVPGLTLMEHAGQACADEIMAHFGQTGEKRALVMAGKGNNGGDGYVIARLLDQKGWQVRVCVLAERGQITGDAAHNLARLPAGMVRFCVQSERLLTVLAEETLQAGVIVDALLGTGLNSDVSGLYRETIDLINASGRPVVSVDIPSGIHGTTGQIQGVAVTASVTVTFAFAKLGHILYPGAELTGRLVVADIGIPAPVMESASGYDFLNCAGIRPLLHRRDRCAHKGHFGHCLIVAGSTGKTGAAALSANSAVRAGSGLVTLAIPESLNPILEVKTTEAMTVPIPDSGCGFLGADAVQAIESLLIGKDALAIGPGLGREPETVALVQALVEAVPIPMVIDADGLNALADDITVLKRKQTANIVLTPHPGEMARLLGASIPDVEAVRISVAQEFACNHGVYLILKGARTIIASPTGAAAINGSGNPGMATGGMGDVLTGIIVSLLGQGYTCWDACCLGVFIHGHSGDLVAADKGEIGMNAGDVREMLPYAYKHLLTAPLS
jgi:hydroxyethylthiazole kinase-like uncharacterized protein yjeF